MNDDEFIIMKPRAMHEMSFTRIQGINFKFDKETFKTSRSYNYLRLSIGLIPIEELNLKHKSRVIVSHHATNPNIIKIKKASPEDENSYSLSGCGVSAKNAHLRLKFKWTISEPLEKWFGKPRPAKYEMIEGGFIIYLNK